MTSPEKERIEKALATHRAFLAYIAANALLHDADKLSPKFLAWSLAGGGVAKDDYPGHNALNTEREEFRTNVMQALLPNLDPISLPFPVACCALEPKNLCEELKDNFTFSGKGPDFLAQLKSNPDEPEPEAHSYQASQAGHDVYDYFRWHHNPTLQIKIDPEVPTALQLFSAGTAGIDGQDTAYETEASDAIARQHHVPNTLPDNLLIATPFGHERQVKLALAADQAMTRNLQVRIKGMQAALADNGTDTMVALAALKTALQPACEQTTIRTGRPLNDITLADHSLSTAALSLAHGARVVMEAAGASANGCYALPMRGKKMQENSEWPRTSFALFSCAVNADHLDDMAMDLKDITAIRQEVEKLFECFEKTFCMRFPVGGAVYRDQHAIHLVVPVLGDESKRWLNKEESNAPVWLLTEAAIKDVDFEQWLLATAKEVLTACPVRFGRELLIGLRRAPIGDQLNRLAEAIRWSRCLSSLGMADSTLPPFKKYNGTQEFFHRCLPGAETGQQAGELCKVCRLRYAERHDRSGRLRRDRGKCCLCRQRTEESVSTFGEIADLESMAKHAADGRLALIAVAFNLNDQLGEESNSGIFCYGEGAKQYPKKSGLQRSNSFGRLRRIWRASQDFLRAVRYEAQRVCAIESEQAPAMRTIMEQPQDLQIILPANRAKALLDYIYERFYLEFGRPAGRVPFHVSALVFSYRTPVYLVLEAARRQRRACLRTESEEIWLCLKFKDAKYELVGDLSLSGRHYCYRLPLPLQQNFQPEGCAMKDQDHFHVNLQVLKNGAGESEWCFAGDLGETPTLTRLVINRLSLAEIGGGSVLNDLALRSEKLPATRIHDIPLACWPQINQLHKLEERIAANKRRSLRGVLARRERTWPAADAKLMEEACELLWREPGRLGPKGWNSLSEEEQNLLRQACINGIVHLVSTMGKRLIK